MSKTKLILEKEGKVWVKEAKLEEPSRLHGLLNPIRWQILRKLAEKPSYPAKVAKELNLHEQKVYYHFKQLLRAGLIKVKSTRQLGGALAKIFIPTSFVFALELPGGEARLAEFPIHLETTQLQQFLYPFVANGKF